MNSDDKDNDAIKEDKECLEAARGVINSIKMKIEKKLTSANITKHKR